MRVIILCSLFFVLEASHDTLTFQLNDLAKKLTGKDVVCDREGQIISLPEATNGTFQSPCFRCICRNKTLICSRKLCPPISPNCPLIVPSQKDECCQECSHCLDEKNKRRQNGELWQSHKNKCSRYVCEGGIKTLSRMYCLNSCPTDIGIHSSAYCCRLCPLTALNDNQFSTTVDPCVRCETVGFWQQCYRLACPVLNCPKDEQKHSRRHCCPRCVKRRELTKTGSKLSSSCQFRHLTYSKGQRFRPDACSQCECSSIGLECKRYVCPVECVGGYFRPQVCCPYCGHLRNQTVSQLNLHSQCVIKLNATQMIWKENDKWSVDPCTSCSCTQGQVICQSQICPKLKCDVEKQVIPTGQCCPTCLELKKHRKDGMCKLMNGHLSSFDGKKLKIKRPCVLILAQQCLFDGELPTFVLKAHNNPNGNLYKLSVELNEKDGVRLGTLNLVKGRELKYKGRRIKLPQSTRVFRATYEKSRFTLDIHSIGLKIVWTESKIVRIHADRRNFRNLCGLCGNFNGIEGDDLLPRFGMNITLNTRAFIDSWQSEEDGCSNEVEFENDIGVINGNKTNSADSVEKKINSCSRLLSKKHKQERRKFSQNCSKLKKSPYLSSCIHQIPVRTFLNKCIVDVCECEELKKTTQMNEPCYCTSINEYAMECGKQGLLTLGQSTQSVTTSFLRIHTKCPPIKLERV